MRSLKIYALHQTLLECQNAKDEIGRACSMCGIGQKWIQYFSWGYLKKSDLLEDTG
jgi:hypothetical protein